MARKMVAATSGLSDERAQWVDAQVADLLGTMPAGRLLRIVEARVVQADQELAERLAAARAGRRGVWLGREPEAGDTDRDLFARGDADGMRQLDAMVDHLARLLRDHSRRAELANPLAALKLLVGVDGHDLPDAVAAAIRDASPEKCRPRATCFVHLTPETLEGDGVARAEEIGALTRRQLMDLLGHHHVTLKPVIDLNDDARPADCFPYAQSVSSKADHDHTVAYRATGPPGQTQVSNLGRMRRRHHRVKTFAGWRVWQHEGRFFWLTPHGRIYITDARGTHKLTADVGRFSDAVEVALAA